MIERIREARKNESGFTLIELLIVIVILGVLAGIVVFAVGAITDTRQDSACKADVKNVEVASEAYYAKTGAYAATMAALLVTERQRASCKDGAAETGNYTIAYTSTDCAVHASPAPAPSRNQESVGRAAYRGPPHSPRHQVQTSGEGTPCLITRSAPASTDCSACCGRRAAPTCC